jgi:hypothetical protein
MKKYSKKPQEHVIRHKVDIVQKGKVFTVFIDGQPLTRGKNQATFASSKDAYQTAEVALAGAPKSGTLWNG